MSWNLYCNLAYCVQPGVPPPFQCSPRLSQMGSGYHRGRFHCILCERRGLLKNFLVELTAPGRKVCRVDVDLIFQVALGGG